MSRSEDKQVWGRFLVAALTWFIPALLILPIYLLILGVSMVAADGALLEATDGVRGGINAAIGPLLIVCGIVVAVLAVVLGTDKQDYINGGFFAFGAIAVGIIIARRALEHLRKHGR